MDLFEYMRSTNMEKEAPLAARMRPRTLDEVVGQEHIIGKDKLLYRAIKADKISSIIFYGPPGTGKTTLAKVIANTTSAEFQQINATVAGKPAAHRTQLRPARDWKNPKKWLPICGRICYNGNEVKRSAGDRCGKGVNES